MVVFSLSNNPIRWNPSAASELTLSTMRSQSTWSMRFISLLKCAVPCTNDTQRKSLHSQNQCYSQPQSISLILANRAVFLRMKHCCRSRETTEQRRTNQWPPSHKLCSIYRKKHMIERYFLWNQGGAFLLSRPMWWVQAINGGRNTGIQEIMGYNVLKQHSLIWTTLRMRAAHSCLRAGHFSRIHSEARESVV